MIKFQHFFKSHQISSNLQNLFESSSETCMWNMSPFREVDLFDRKMLTVPALEISWNINIFSKFTNFYQTCKTYLNHHQKHACEIWAYSEKFYFSQKNADSTGPRNMKFQHFFQNSPNFLKLAEHIWIIIRNMHMKFEPIRRSSTYFIEKCRQCWPFEISWNFNIFSKFIKFHQTCRTYWNHHQTHACEIWAFSEKLNFFTEKYRQCRP